MTQNHMFEVLFFRMPSLWLETDPADLRYEKQVLQLFTLGSP